MPFCYCTLLTSDNYLPGALVLAQSLRLTNTPHDLVVLVTPSVSSNATAALSTIYTRVITIPMIRSTGRDELQLLGRPELDVTYSKLSCFNPSILPYERFVFLDADTLVVANVDELFGYVGDSVEFAAAPDIGWPDCFNSGVFVGIGSEALYNGLIKLSEEATSFDGGDQGLLNMYFSKWSIGGPNTARLPFTFNVTPSTFYSYLPAYLHFKDTIKIVHFIGLNKPWKVSRRANGSIIQSNGISDQTVEFIELWWTILDQHFLYKKLDRFVLDRDWSLYATPSDDVMRPFAGEFHLPHHNHLPTIPEGSDFANYHLDWNEAELGKLKKLNILRRPSYEAIKPAVISPVSSSGSSSSKKSKSSIKKNAGILETVEFDLQSTVSNGNNKEEHYKISPTGVIEYKK